MKENFLTRIFRGGEESVIYTAEDVHRDLTAFILLYLSDIQEEIERKEVPIEITKTASLLEQFGLTNTTNAQIVGKIKSEIETHNLEYERKKTQLTFMQEVWKKFGKDAMVVRYDHFFQILEKYDMVCGSFDRYTGAIPQEAIDILAKLKELKSEAELDKFFSIDFSSVGNVCLTNESKMVKTLTNIARMPFIPMEWSTHEAISKIRGAIASGLEVLKAEGKLSPIPFFIAAPAADMMPLKLVVRFGDSLTTAKSDKALREALQKHTDWNRWPSLYEDEREHVRNQAIREEEARLQSIIEKSGIGRYCKLDFIKTQPLPERKLYDPFICSLTPCGVLIHAKWGPEAEDATIRRYEQLRDAVIGKGSAE